MPIRLVITIDTRPGLGHLQKEAFEALAPLVRAEPGCLQYDLHSVDSDPDRFVLFELWESEQALAAHDESAHMIEAAQSNGRFRAGPAQVVQVSAEPIG